MGKKSSAKKVTEIRIVITHAPFCINAQNCGCSLSMRPSLFGVLSCPFSIMFLQVEFYEMND